ncbi:MAG: bifunctional diaminohydroxyphosphoribosylaminopyrimidine deaminase/5-amino-6-(5-phosphoribosylamino)uracil reductase RibD [Epsilonproteobacteria bacterium]|nr:bifunctional diaminohydroxyphosphoribosylaminopyrimidine deaminase/5-amino-6-(5-phosphoribosylamino)uracil reductase RibD [Campylobacterota bacterium]NPA56704.1 bifunctional diaminohydroxyphosphoribosylaminopyrimidine deaminase/5-amino-6-(5-phosphoribosylamino)uracil reductase RibD [Campylobacterota bacterium]
MVNFDRFYMEAALDEGWKYQLLTYPNPAVGASIVKGGRLLSIAAHQEAGGPHAEVLAIRDAYHLLTGDDQILSIRDPLHLHNYLTTHSHTLFHDATLYVTLEPCFHYGKTPPCSLLIKELGFRRVVIGTLDPTPKAGGGAHYLAQKGVEVEIGVCEEEARALIEPFVRWTSSRFVFFKLAQHLNGVITGGQISSYPSRELVHKIRDKVDLLVVGGGTVRIDRPILDARLVGGRAPNILIYSRRGKFNRKIPLFNVPGREVSIESSLESIKEHRFIMIEGGEGMLHESRWLVDWYLWFLAPTLRREENYRIDKKITFLKSVAIGPDLLIWSRNG